VKLCDFGLSHIIDPKLGKAHYDVKAGTPGYMAPELNHVSFNQISLYVLVKFTGH